MLKKLKLKRICLTYMLLFVTYLGNAQGIYDYTFRDVEQKEIHLNSFSGKKILFIILPFNLSDSLIHQIREFGEIYGNNVKLIGVLSREEGFFQENQSFIKDKLINSGILITDVLDSKKGVGQSPLMEWLTNKKENGHFDMDVKGAGQKFFINEQGQLYAVLGPRLELISPFIQKIINATENGKKSNSAGEVNGNARP